MRTPLDPIALVVFLAGPALAAVFWGQKQEGAEPVDVYDLRLSIPVGKPIAASLSAKVEGTAELTVRGEVTEEELSTVIDVQFVDEYSLLEDDRWDASRTYARWFQTDNRVPVDPELNGVRLMFDLRDGNYEVNVDDRLVTQETMDQQLVLAESVGVWLALPQAVPIGGEFAVEPSSLVCLLTDADGGVTSSEGTFSLKSVDDDLVATLDGRLEAAAVEGKLGFVTTYEGDCTMLVDIANGRLLHLEWNGTTNFSGGAGDVTAKGTAAFRVELTTVVGAAAEKVLRRKPAYRDVPRKLRREGLTLELPSHWFLLGGEAVTQFQTSLHGADFPVTLEFKVIDIPDGMHEEVMDSVVSKLEEDQGDLTAKKVTSRLGKGRSVRFTSGGNAFLIELLPLGPRQLLRLRLFGPETVFSNELKSWKKARRSLEVLEDG